MLEDAGSSHGTFARRRARRPARCRCATARRSGSATRSCASSAGATRPRRGARSSSRRARACVVPALGRPRVARRRRSSGCARACARATRSSGSTPTRARSAGCCKDLERGHVPAAVRQRRGAVRAARRHALAGRPDRRWPSSASARPGRRGWRGCSPTSASAASSPAWRGGGGGGARRRRACWRKLFKPREKVVHRRRRRGSTALYRRGGWVLFTRPALIALAALIVAGHRRVRLPDRRPLRHAVRRRAARSGSAGSCSCSGASRSWPCTRPRTG